MAGITHIDFHLDNHVVQAGEGKLRIFVGGNTTKKPLEFRASDIMRIIRVATEQIDNVDHDYADAL